MWQRRVSRLCLALLGCAASVHVGAAHAGAAQAGSTQTGAVHTGAVHAGAAARAPFGLESRTAAPAYLHMPHRADGPMPALLSQTGAFKNLEDLTPADGLVPYDLIVAFWSDGAEKTRWVAIPPNEKIRFSPEGEWMFPKGTVFIKTFELSTVARDRKRKHRLETRILVCDEDGGVYGVDYKWRADRSDADLLPSAVTESVPLQTPAGTSAQTWYYPSRQDCLACHNALAGGVLGVKTRQLNHDFHYPNGVVDNELRAWNQAGLFNPALKENELEQIETLAALSDESRSLEDRARSYLDANCSHCHRPGGTVANFDARYSTPLDHQNLVDGSVLIDQGIDKPRIIAPHDFWRSIAFMRIDTIGDIKMPPLARNTIDTRGVELMRQWIMSMPGRDVLAPPAIEPKGGSFNTPVDVTLTVPEPGAAVRYTLDGSVPGTADARYDKPIHLTGPAVIRTRAYKDGFTRSIVTQDVFMVGN